MRPILVIKMRLCEYINNLSSLGFGLSLSKYQVIKPNIDDVDAAVHNIAVMSNIHSKDPNNIFILNYNQSFNINTAAKYVIDDLPRNRRVLGITSWSGNNEKIWVATEEVKKIYFRKYIPYVIILWNTV